MNNFIVIPCAFFIIILLSAFNNPLSDLNGTYQSISLCEGETFTWPDGTVIDTTGIYIIDNGTCTDTLDVTFLPVQADIVFSETLCQGDTLFWNGNSYTESGYYIVPSISQNGCGYNEILELQVLASSNLSIILCEGEELTIQDTTLTEPGTYAIADQLMESCADTIIVTITVTSDTTLFYHECADDFTEPGIYESIDNCITTILTVNPKTPDVITEIELCEGDSITWQGETYFSPGTFEIDTLDANNCPYKFVLNIYEAWVLDCLTDIEQLGEAPLLCYPNPVQEYLFLEGDITESTELAVQIFDFQGNFFRNHKRINNRLNVAELKEGLYYLRVTHKNKIVGQLTFVKN